MGRFLSELRGLARPHTHAATTLRAILYNEEILQEGGEPVRVSGAAVGHEFFAALGVEPMAGRTFTAAEDARGQPGVIVLSHRMWNQRFGGNPAAVGRSIKLGQNSFTISGIMPADFDYPPQTEYWVPLRTGDRSIFRDRTERMGVETPLDACATV